MRDDLFLKLFRSPIIKNQVLNKTVGGAIQNLASVKELKTIEIPLPPLAEQAVIAQTLDTLLAQVDNIKIRLDAIPEILKTFRQSVLASAVSGKLTEEWRGNNECDEWKAVTLGEVGKGFNYGSSTKSQKEGDIPVLRMGNLQRGKLEWGNLVFTSDKDEIAKYLLEEGDVLFNRTNSPELVGKTSIYRGERKSIYAGYLIRVKGSDELNSEFLNILLNSPDAKSYCMTIKSDGVSQSNINAQKLRAFSFNNPSYEEQLQIVRRVEELLAFTDQIEQQVKNAQGRVNNLTQSILAKAFRGELTADWRAENPDLISGENSAGVLLVNIKEEREKLKPKKVTKKKAVRKPRVK
jgi:type I restriction enzyme S subunit